MKQLDEASLQTAPDHPMAEFPFVDPITLNAISAAGLVFDDVRRRLLGGEPRVHLSVGYFATEASRSYALLHDGRIKSNFWLTADVEWMLDHIVIYAPDEHVLPGTVWAGIRGADLTSLVGHDLIVAGGRIADLDPNRSSTIVRIKVEFQE